MYMAMRSPMIYDTAVIVKNGPELSPATNAIIPGVWKSHNYNTNY